MTSSETTEPSPEELRPPSVQPSIQPSIQPSSTPAPPRVALVGLHGHARVHLANVRRLEALGSCRLVAVADPVPPDAAELDPAVGAFTDLDTLLASTEVDVVVLCTPIHTHAALAETAMRAGADVLLEKPPAPTMAEFDRIQRVCAETGRSCQIGFQSLGSAAVAALATAVADGALGEVTLIAARGSWIRTQQYYQRSRWAGRRELDGIPVMDGALTNPFAHAVATALRVDGSDRAQDVLSVEPDLFHANPIESDDTSAVRVRTRRGSTLLVAVSLGARTHTDPEIVVRGTLATAILSYTTDTIRVDPAPGVEAVPQGLAGAYGRTDLLANLLAHRTDPTVGLLADLATTGAFSAVLESIRLAPPPAAIPAACVTWHGSGDDRHPVVTDVEEWIERAVDRGQTFSELGAPWTARAEFGRRIDLRLGTSVVASYDPGVGVRHTSSPRPFLHPVRTLGGLTVSDAHPDDHDWHLGLGVGVQDVGGANLWGGRTYLRDVGYRWRADHGRIEPISRPGFDVDRADLDLRWTGPAGNTLLTEQRRLHWFRPSHPGPNHAGPNHPGPSHAEPNHPDQDLASRIWLLDLDFTLSTPGSTPVALGSPGSHGRSGGGYGGLFWRLPRADEMSVATPDAIGEAAVHGTVASWLSACLRFGDRWATVLLQPRDPATGGDPWFVRLADYPGIGASLAWDRPVSVSPDTPLRRSYRVVVADGRVEPAQLDAIAGAEPATDWAGVGR